MTTLKETFDKLLVGVVIDAGLCHRLYRYHVDYLNQSKEYLEFFAGNQIGVQVVRFTIQHTKNFFQDVLKLDMLEVEREVRQVTTINHDFKISSDPMNLMLMYLIHRIGTSLKLKEKERERGMYDAALIFFYRCLVIRQSEWFHFTADPKIAQAAYARLSNKFLLKQLGSWKEVMDYRAKDLVGIKHANKEDSKGSIHIDNLLVFEDDLATVYAIGDSENRIRSMYKYYYREFDKAVTSKDMILSASSTIIDVEGIEKLRDRTRSVEQAIALLQNTIHDKNSFVKPEYVKIITDINANTSQRMLVSVLEWISENYTTTKHHKKLDEFIRTIMVHSYHLLNDMAPGETHDLAMVLVTLKNLYLSTRSTDPELAEIRQLGQTIIKEAAGKVNNSLEMATRTSVILYITLRGFVLMK